MCESIGHRPLLGRCPATPLNFKHNPLRQGTGTADPLTLLRLFLLLLSFFCFSFASFVLHIFRSGIQSVSFFLLLFFTSFLLLLLSFFLSFDPRGSGSLSYICDIYILSWESGLQIMTSFIRHKSIKKRL